MVLGVVWMYNKMELWVWRVSAGGEGGMRMFDGNYRRLWGLGVWGSVVLGYDIFGEGGWEGGGVEVGGVWMDGWRLGVVWVEVIWMDGGWGWCG